MNFGTHIAHAFFTVCIASALTAASSVFAMEVGGVKFDETAKVANHDLQLNGAGVRYKAVFKVYAAGLYLSGKKTKPADVLAAPGPKRFSIVTLRDVSAEEFGRNFMAGIQKNSEKAEKAKLTNQFLKFGELFASIPELKNGDVLTVDWIPDSGMLLMINGKKISDIIPDIGFYNVFLKIWFGEYPPDAKLKQALLGQAEEIVRPAGF